MVLTKVKKKLEDTQVIGVSKIARKPRSKKRWLLWGLVIIIAVVLCSLHMRMLIVKYLAHETSMNTEIYQRHSYEFPQLEFFLVAPELLFENYTFDLEWCSLKVLNDNDTSCSILNSFRTFDVMSPGQKTKHFIFNGENKDRKPYKAIVSQNEVFNAEFSLTRNANKNDAACVMQYIQNEVTVLFNVKLSHIMPAVYTRIDVNGLSSQPTVAVMPNLLTNIMLDIYRESYIRKNNATCAAEYPDQIKKYLKPYYQKELPYERSSCGRVCDDLWVLEHCNCTGVNYGDHIIERCESIPDCNEQNCNYTNEQMEQQSSYCQQLCLIPCSTMHYQPIVHYTYLQGTNQCDRVTYRVVVAGPPGAMFRNLTEVYMYDQTQFFTDIAAQLNFYLCISLAIFAEVLELILVFTYKRSKSAIKHIRKGDSVIVNSFRRMFLGNKTEDNNDSAAGHKRSQSAKY